MSVQDTNNLPQNDARHHALNIAQSLREIAQHASEDVSKVDSPQGQEMLDQTAERIQQMAEELEEFGYQSHSESS